MTWLRPRIVSLVIRIHVTQWSIAIGPLNGIPSDDLVDITHAPPQRTKVFASLRRQPALGTNTEVYFVRVLEYPSLTRFRSRNSHLSIHTSILDHNIMPPTGEEVSIDPHTDQIFVGEGDSQTPMKTTTTNHDTEIPTDDSDGKNSPTADEDSSSVSEEEPLFSFLTGMKDDLKARAPSFIYSIPCTGR